MQKRQWNINSWHGQLAFVYGPLNRCHHTTIDVCTYTRACIKGAVIATITTVILSAVIAGLFDFAIWGVVALMSGVTVELSFLGMVGLAVILLVVLCCIVFFGVAAIKKIIDWRGRIAYKKHFETPVPRQPSALRQMYDSFKQKTCFQIELVDDDDR